MELSKFLAYVLRHNAEKMGLKLRADGYCLLEEVMGLHKFKKNNWTFEMVKHVVDSNDKKRYEMMEENGVNYIRAV